MAGKIVHFELPSADADRAVAFWSGLFGWNVGEPMSPEMDYRMTQVSDDQGGAIFASDSPGTGPVVYFDTDDIDASMAKVRELSGEAGEKTPVPTHGWFAACKDTEGNSFSLWQSDESAA
jgi:predicted enzyme related to lactoylglutathione lyase